MFNKNKNPSIIFRCEEGYDDAYAKPYPAGKKLPEWYKRMATGIETPPGSYPGQTIKTCMPVLDALSAGYIIPSAVPVRFSVTEDGGVSTAWKGGKDMIASHSEAQVSSESGLAPPFMKWINPWAIELPKGYSAIFTQPFNQSENVLFKCLTGVVDCDTYTNPVNFPFVWTGPRPYEGMIPEGTPLVQVIPFKREDWEMQIREETQEEAKERLRVFHTLEVRSGSYKNRFRSMKHWR